MTNPAIVEITAGKWTKVATNVKNGTINILDHSKEYLFTQRDTGEAEPTSTEEGAIFEGKSRSISNTIFIDVYIYSTLGGKVRVDL